MIKIMVALWSYMIPLLISLLLAVGFKKMLKIKLDIAFAIGYMSFCLIMYFFSVCGLPLSLGYAIFGIFLAVIIGAGGIKEKRICFLKNRDIRVIVAFIVLYTMVFVFDLNRGFTHWDEMSHWGPMIKENLRLNQLYSVMESKLQVHKDYPPVIALFETAWSNICGGYSEKYLYRSLHMLIASMIFPMVTYFEDSLKNKKSFWIMAIMIFIPFLSVCTVLSLNDGNMLSTIYTDGVLAITAAFCFFLILTLHKYTCEETLIQAIALSFLMLVKQIGFEYFCLCYLLLILISFYSYKAGINKKKIIQKLIFLICIPVLFEISWNFYVKYNQLDRQFEASKIDLSIIKAIITGTDTQSWQYRGTIGYFDALYTKPLFMLGEHIISYIDMFIICTIIYILLMFLQKKIRKNYYIFPIFSVYVIGIFGHAMMMWITYMFCYCESDFLGLACYERYMNVIWIANCIILVFIFLQILNELFAIKNNILTIFEGAIAVACIFVITWSDTSIFLMPALENNSSLKEYYEEADFIADNTDENSSIFIVTQSYTGYFEYVFQYLTMPRSYNNSYYSLGEPYSEEDDWTRNIVGEEFLEVLEDYDYIFFYHIDEQFIENYGIMLDNVNDIVFEDGYLYNICHNDNGRIRLEVQGIY